MHNIDCPRIVIVGAGFGGLSAAKKLAQPDIDLTVIDAHNYHLFQPLLYQVACAALAPSDIAVPIRSTLKHHKHVRVLMDRVTSIDTIQKHVYMGEMAIPYDYLVLAPGSRDNYFGHPEWEEHAFSIKSLDDATQIRQAILTAFEVAERTQHASDNEALLTFVLVGAGPTGVEMAGAIAELSRFALTEEFQAINPSMARIILIEAGGRVLPSLYPALSKAAHQALSDKGVEVLTDTKVEVIDAEGVVANGKRIYSKHVIWSAGVQAQPVSQWFLGFTLATGKGGRVCVTSNLSLENHPDIFIIGDAAEVVNQPLPGVAPVAKQQGVFVADVLLARTRHHNEPSAFKYRDYGTLATIGRYSAVADFGFMRLRGFMGWVVWSLAHIYYLIGFRNRIIVFIKWIWEYFTFKRGARLIITEKT